MDSGFRTAAMDTAMAAGAMVMATEEDTADLRLSSFCLSY